MKKFSGFTLIEVLIALAIFAILASITSSSLYYAFSTRTRVNEQSERLNALQLAISLMQQDTSQIIDRPIRTEDMQLLPAFIAEKNYTEFTRDGYINPNGLEKRSTLKRIAYLCKKNKLIRRTWDSLDSTNRKNYADKVLIEDLSNCHLAYLNQDLQVLPSWQEQSAASNQNRMPFPKAIQVNLTIENQGKMNLLFIIPRALYAAI